MVAKWKQYSKQEIEELYNKATSIKNFFQLMGYKGDPSALMKKEFSEKYPQYPLSKISNGGYEDLTEQQFGFLLVKSLDKIKTAEKGSVHWNCLCTRCGKEVSVAARNLKTGNSQSCGCNRAAWSRDNLVGKRYGFLDVLFYDDETSLKKKATYFICKCSKCGSIKSIRASDLKSGHTLSCGCLKSKGEAKINSILSILKIDFETQKSFEQLKNLGNNLYFDFYLPQYNCCIEYQGIQHYKPVEQFGGISEFEHRQYLDDLKRQYCKEHNIKLIEIPYTDYGKLSKQYLKDKIDGI